MSPSVSTLYPGESSHTRAVFELVAMAFWVSTWVPVQIQNFVLFTLCGLNSKVVSKDAETSALQICQKTTKVYPSQYELSCRKHFTTEGPKGRTAICSLQNRCRPAYGISCSTGFRNDWMDTDNWMDGSQGASNAI